MVYIMKYIITIILFLNFTAVMPQVGIGTTSPTAALEISTENAGIPALRLQPQLAPVGTEAGQLAIFDRELYYYDHIRTMWLSVASQALSFSIDGSADGIFLGYGGNMVSTNNGALMPFDGVVVAYSARVTGGSLTKSMRIFRRRGTAILNFIDFSLVNGEFISGQVFRFSRGDYLNVRVNANGGEVNNPTVTLWVKWRKEY